MGEIVSLLNGANLRMHRMVFYIVIIISVARHTAVSAYLEYYPAYRRSIEEPPSPPENNFYRDIAAEKYILERLERLFQDQRQKQLRLFDRQQNPEFTFHFPDAAAQRRQSLRDAFAVAPSDPRYYQPDRAAEFSSSQSQREDDKFQRASKSEDEDTTVQETTAVADEKFNTGNTAEVNNKNIFNNFDQTTAEVEPNVLKAILAPDNTDDILFIAISAGFSVVALVSLISLFICWYKLHRNTKAAADVEYPAYGVTGPNKELSPTGDRRLAQSAQMYHYQHQKQQIIAMESSRANNERRGSVSDADSDEENEEGDYTVYECPGLAATGEMEVKNPLFQDDPTPATTVQNTEDSTADRDKK